MFITESTTEGSTYTRTEYSTSANKRSGAPVAMLEINRGRIQVDFGRYATEEGRLFFLVSLTNRTRTFKTEAGARRAIAAHLAA